jgi:hypothetical protein
MRVALRGILVGVVLLAAAAGGLVAQELRFSGAPTIGDRSLQWRWEPIPGLDPYFLGNTILEEDGEVPNLVPGSLRILKSNVAGTVLFAVGTVDDRIYVLAADEDGAWTGRDTLRVPPSRLLDLDIHRSELVLLGGLESGEIAVWDLRPDAASELEVYPALEGPCEHVRFLVESTDPDERRLVTAGEQGGVLVWFGPGALMATITTAPASSIGLTGSGSLLVVGDLVGVIRVYDPIAEQLIARLDGHQARTNQFLFTSNQRRLFSLDAAGRVLVWRTSEFSGGSTNPVYEVQVEDANGLRIGLRQPDGALLYSLDADGNFQIFDGFDGRLYRSSNLSAGAAVPAATFNRFGRRIFVGSSEGSIAMYRTGFCTPSVIDTVCFAGYKIWRSETPLAEDAILLRVFGFGDSTWGFVGEERVFVDPDSLIARGSMFDEPIAGPHNGMPYYYSITAFERRYLNGAVFDVLLGSIEDGFYRPDPSGDPAPVSPHGRDRTQLPLLDNVIVVPNPYEAGKVPWDAELGEHIEFRHLPEQATIRIYTVAGDLLKTIEHGLGQFGERTDTRRWDLTNQKNEEVASGVYIYHISTELNAEEAKGYFVIVR